MSIAVSFSLFGDDPEGIYIEGFRKNQKLYSELPEDYHLYLYLPPRLLEPLSLIADPQMTSLVPVPDEPEDQRATFWRFRALRDVPADFYLFRDLDSRPIARERASVREWMDSDKNFHVIRDHSLHCVPMLAGLWGCRAGVAKKIPGMVRMVSRANFYGIDQVFLQNFVWPMAKRSVYASVDCEWTFGTDIHPIQGDLSEGFCGQDLRGDDTPRNPQNNRGEFKGVRYSDQASTSEVLG